MTKLSAISHRRSVVSSGSKAERRNLRAPTAFTLIEMLVVIAIIGILAGLTLGVAQHAREKGKRSRASAEIAAIENALESFKNDTGYYPQGDGSADSSTNVYNKVAVGPKTYMSFHADQLRILGTTTNIADPFGIPYRYLSPGTNNAVSFDLWSFGSNKTNGFFAGTDHDTDDITNWKQN